MTSGVDYVVLPCSGLDKSAGQVTREAALELQTRHPELTIICPVLLSQDAGKYADLLRDRQVIVLDGCGTRCAAKIAREKGCVIAGKVFVPDVIKEGSFKLEKDLRLGPEGLAAACRVVEKMEEMFTGRDSRNEDKKDEVEWVIPGMEFLETMVDKFILKVPKESYMFSENDSWAQVLGDQARVGVTDFLQTMTGDIYFVELPEVGSKIDMFDDVGTFESGKAVLQVISPVSGIITAVNTELVEHPELINEDPYRGGWIYQVESEDFQEDLDLLIDGGEYFSYMEKKAHKEIAARQK